MGKCGFLVGGNIEPAPSQSAGESVLYELGRNGKHIFKIQERSSLSFGPR